MMTRDLLIELGMEEMPARFIQEGQQQFGEKIAQWLEDHLIPFESYQTFSTPRRLAVRVKGVEERQEDRIEEVRGPALHIAQTSDGEWTQAAIGFARKQQVDVEELRVKEYNGTPYIFASKYDQGEKTIDLLQKDLHKAFHQLSFPISMRWGENIRFIRPVRWMVCLYGEDVIPVEWAGVRADRISRGHRFLGADISILSPATYTEQLKDQFVWLDVEERKASIQHQLSELERKYDWVIPIDESLLDEVTHLVEYPTVLVGQFNPDFLTLPKLVLITTMREHQRYFPVEDDQGTLLPYFVAVRNGNDQHLDKVIRGNEKVLEARLADARFFFEEDLKLNIDQAIEQLDRIIFQQELGTIGHRVLRIRTLAEQIAHEMDIDHEWLPFIDRAAQICKFDLVTQMVNEFSNLEGFMGYEYAKAAGEDHRVALAIREYHRPRFAGDDIPHGLIGNVLSLADKVDMIAACFGIGLIPSGSQDPYSLRRKALGVLQILLKHPQIALNKLLDRATRQLESAQLLQRPKEQVLQELNRFFIRRFQTVLNEAMIRYDVVEAVLADEIVYPQFTLDKAKVLMNQLEKDDFKNQVEGYTRVANLVQAHPITEPFDDQRLSHPAEFSMYEAYRKAKDLFDLALQKKRPDEMYQALQSMVPTIHNFFDQVMVMVEDHQVRQNRLALLQLIHRLTEQYADFRKIVFS